MLIKVSGKRENEIKQSKVTHPKCVHDLCSSKQEDTEVKPGESRGRGSAGWSNFFLIGILSLWCSSHRLEEMKDLDFGPH